MDEALSFQYNEPCVLRYWLGGAPDGRKTKRYDRMPNTSTTAKTSETLAEKTSIKSIARDKLFA